MNAFRLGWLFARTERSGRGRLAGVAVGVAVGVALMLLVVAAYNGLNSRNERSTWTYLSGEHANAERTEPLGPDEAVALTSGRVGAAPEPFRGAGITRLDVATSPDTALRIPGVERIPRPGEYLASPALERLIAENPADQLGDRYGNPIGTIDDSGLASPEALVAVVGADVDQVKNRLGATLVHGFGTFTFPSQGYELVTLAGGFAVIFPVGVLIVILTRLGQAARSERISTIRLIGARPSQVAGATAVETGLPSLVGAILGVGLFWALRPIAAMVPVEGMRFYSDDLAVSGAVQSGVALGVAVITCAIAYVTALRTGFGPLGASRERQERRPRILSLLPLVLGGAVIAGTTVLTISGVPIPYTGELLVAGFVLMTTGLLFAGPYLTGLVSRAGARGSGRPSVLLAMNRITRHPRATFRAVGGMALALFVVTTFVVGATTEREAEFAVAPPAELLSPNVLVASVAPGEPDTDSRLERGLAQIARTPGVNAAFVGRSFEGITGEGTEQISGLVIPADGARAIGLDPEPGAEFIAIEDPGGYFGNFEVTGEPARISTVSAADAMAMNPMQVLIGTDGSAAALDRARTAVVESDLPLQAGPTTRAEDAGIGIGAASWAARYSILAGIGVLIAAAISAISLAISTAAGIIDRRRVLGLLRLSGAPARLVRRMIVIETAVPLLAVIVPSIGLGWLSAWGLVTGLSEGRRTVSVPDPEAFGVLGVCLLLVGLAVAVAFAASRPGRGAAATRFE
ncbi:hypothetical protein BMH25_09300 [Leucobacter sp. OLCALW19]|uniref:FtsX-like permease family protein n=1 Tax=Leucobacter sp. OLCALW19 TaxID=1914915 RepID=UPI000C18C952|nr:FtsX-like permease family protein [Leucobacter sp. OLCALW19]PII82914.1 hypothetical protein BMH25_09300 [Leucobacter sp. OLCALW19]